jgi:hypothetical protein
MYDGLLTDHKAGKRKIQVTMQAARTVFEFDTVCLLATVDEYTRFIMHDQ